MSKTFGYMVDMSTVSLNDANVSWIQAMPLGKYDHPIYGEIDFTPSRIKAFAQSVKDNVRGQELNIDYDHRMGEAAGWVQAAEARADGLYLQVQWTRTAAEKIRDRAYRYFSPEFADEWKHPQTGAVHKDVLFGGGLTNRPFLKGIAPVNLSELFQASDKTEGGNMDPKELRKLLGLSEDASDDKVIEAIKALQEPPKPKDDPKPQDDELKKLAEDNPVIAKMLADQEAMRKQLAENAASLRLAEVKSSVATLSDAKSALPPAVVTQLEGTLVQMPKELADEVVKAFADLKSSGFVPLGEIGHAGQQGGGNNAKTATTKFREAVAAYQKANPDKDYADAVTIVSANDPELYEKYREESFSWKEA